MHECNSFSDIHRLLDDWPTSGKHRPYNLEHMRELLDFLGNPEKKFKVLHVAGTSGKTSTAYYAAALLKAAGQKVGLTVSPHVDEVNERVQIDLVPLPEAEFCRRFSEFLSLIKKCRVVPSYFELFVAFAFWEFAARQVEYVVVEVGVGGLSDSTNVFEDANKICIITDIGIDHTKVLGSTLPEIAEQKAGIIKLRNAVFCNRQGEEVIAVVQRQAQQKQADLHILYRGEKTARYSFLPLFQQRNFRLSLAAVSYVLKRDELQPLDELAITQAAHVRIPGRMEVMRFGSRILVLDLSHNEQKMQALVDSIHGKYPRQAVAALVRMPAYEHSHMRMSGGLDVLAKDVQHVIVTSLADRGDEPDRSFNEGRVRELCLQVGLQSFEIIPEPARAFEVLRARPEPILLVTGSTYLLNHIRALVGAQRSSYGRL